jgi:hypothetical protein
MASDKESYHTSVDGVDGVDVDVESDYSDSDYENSSDKEKKVNKNKSKSETKSSKKSTFNLGSYELEKYNERIKMIKSKVEDALKNAGVNTDAKTVLLGDNTYDVVKKSLKPGDIVTAPFESGDSDDESSASEISEEKYNKTVGTYDNDVPSDDDDNNDDDNNDDMPGLEAEVEDSKLSGNNDTDDNTEGVSFQSNQYYKLGSQAAKKLKLCNTCGKLYENDMVNVNVFDEKDPDKNDIICWHCLFWMNYEIKMRKEVDGLYGMKIVDYILKCKDNHNVDSCTRKSDSGGCHLCEYLCGFPITDVKDSFKLKESNVLFVAEDVADIKDDGAEFKVNPDDYEPDVIYI